MKNIIFLLLALASSSFAQQVGFDLSFGNAGVVSGKGVSYIEKTVPLPDGKMLCFGTVMNNKGVAQPAILKFDSHGKLDSTFNNVGILQDTIKKDISPPGSYHPYSFMCVQPDGSIFTANLIYSNSYFKTYITCSDSNGNPKLSFGKSGALLLDTIEYLNRPVLAGFSTTPDNEIVVSWNGYYTKGTTIYGYILSKFDSTGLIDRRFGTDGFLVFENNLRFSLNDIVVLKEGSIICAGSDNSDPINEKTALIKLNADGTLNREFGNDGKVIIDADTCNQPDWFSNPYTETARKVVELENHQLIVISITDGLKNRDHILRLMPNGTMDKTFGNNGFSKGITSIYDVAVLNDGGMVACNGGNYTYFSPDGIEDSSMHLNCPFNIMSVAIQDDNKFIFGGRNPQNTINVYPFLARLNFDSSVKVPEINAPTDEVSISPIPFRDVITFQSNLSLIRKVTLFDLNGRCVLSKSVAETSYTLNVNLAPGMYLCKIVTSKGIEYHKLVSTKGMN